MEDFVFEDEILDFIDVVRDAVPNAVEVFTQGNCGSFALILAKAFPGGTIKYIIKNGHTIYEYGPEWYDITGKYDLDTNKVKYDDAYDLFEHFGAGRAMIYLRNNYKTN